MVNCNIVTFFKMKIKGIIAPPLLMETVFQFQYILLGHVHEVQANGIETDAG